MTITPIENLATTQGDEDDKDIPAGTFHGDGEEDGDDKDIPAGTFHS